ncbi:MAG TPA: amino acid ABC transporter permease [Clostridiales bacterium]|nr:amino acid ABC transporter permease [Clostridiales bacterium]
MTFSIMLSTMSVGMLRTCGIFVLTLIGSLPLGILVALGRMNQWAPLRGLSKTDGSSGALISAVASLKPIQSVVKVYISIMRGTPLMLQLLVWYFGPYYLFGWDIGGYRFTAIILGFVLNYAAYFAEIYRSGIEAIPKGQYEAAAVLGYTKTQTFAKIILPQVIKIILPSITNEVITLVKDTSLSFTLAYQEVFSIAKQISASQTSFMPFLIAGVFYYIANYVVAFFMERFEKRLSYYR